MKCLVLAAGKGSRLCCEPESKPLYPVLGVPLIERSIRAAKGAGADTFVVVTGYQGECVTRFLESLAYRLDVSITCQHNPDWEQENGLSVLSARHFFDGPFLLIMADHLVETPLIRELQNCALDAEAVRLAVDADMGNPLVEAEDATRVRLDEEGWIRDIGKGIERADAYDTGVFLATPALFTALERAAADGDTDLSAGVQLLADEGLARAVDVTGRSWIDVDDQKALKDAEKVLLYQLSGKPSDGPVSRWLNRPLSIALSRLLVKLPVSPNMITLISFSLSVAAAFLFSLGSYAMLAAGAVLAQAGSVLDGCDGEVARLKYLGSDYGGWLDAVLDRYADALLLFGLTWHVTQGGANPVAWLAGFAAIIGSFLLSYTADKYDSRMRSRISQGLPGGLRLGRDVRVFLIMIGALLNQALLTLVIIALLMNFETVRRLWICRNPDGLSK
jgi:choline kinase/phosphatidylglycerophosphate synthase